MSRFIFVIFVVIALFFVSSCTSDNAESSDANHDALLLSIEVLNGDIAKKNDELLSLKNKVTELEKSVTESQNTLISYVTSINEDVNNNEFNVAIDEIISVNSTTIKSSNFSAMMIAELLGEPIDRIEYQEANEVVLKYNDVIFTYVLENENESLKGYTLLTDKYCTSKGATVGMEKKEILKLYDRNYYGFYINEESISMGEKTGIRFDLQNEIVTQITIWLMYE